MFEQATLSAGPAARRIWSTCLGVTGQALVISGMILTPMIWPEILPKAQTFLAGPIIAPPPTGPAVRPRGSATSPRPIFQRPTSAVFREPSAVPVRVQMLDEPAAGLAGSIAGIPNGGPQGIEGGVLGAVLTTGSQIAPPPRVIEPRAEPPKPAAPASTIRLRVSQLDSARLRHRVEPIYPPIAIQARISGIVELRGVIGVDGHIRELRVLRGHPLLVKAALDAVSHWIYEPPRLNGEAVEVDAPIMVTFHLH